MGDNKSTCLDITCGVPQGSVIGPKLFILYINDIARISDVLKLILFADDTNIFCSGTDLKKLAESVNNELSKLNIWFNINKLSLNLTKTTFILFGKRGMKEKINLQVNGVEIERVNEYKVLGVIIDNLLTWKPHVKTLQRKLAKSVSILWKMQKLLNQNSLKTIYSTLITPHLHYCAEVWGHTYKNTLEPLFKLQKRAIRIIHHVPYRSHTNDLFIKSEFLKLHDIIKYNTLQIVYLASRRLLTPNIQCLFLQREDTHNLRGCMIFKRKRVNSTQKGHTVSIVGVLAWNKLEDKIKMSESLKVFKLLTKHLMISDYE